MTNNIIDCKTAAGLLCMAPATLRKNYVPRMAEGVHYFRPNKVAIRFYREPLLNWYENQGDPLAHAEWLKSRAQKNWEEASA
jgi:hypothetical protein